jgi:hypothetical protein
MDNIKFEVVVFDLRKYNTVEDIQKIAKENNISIDAKKVSDLSVKYTKVFIDKVSNELFAVVYKGSSEITMSKSCEDLLFNVSSLSPSKEKAKLSIDDLLDKINEKGFNSLTAHEKFFLKKNS